MFWGIMAEATTRCGFVALVGRPNVGKSTLLNHLVGKKLSITSRRPQTTRHRLTGICTLGSDQVLFVDTPGLQTRSTRAMDRYMSRVIWQVLAEVDVVVMVSEWQHWLPADKVVLEQIKKAGCDALLAVNKIDLLSDKSQLLPFMQDRAKDFRTIIPIASLKNEGLATLMQEVLSHLPHGPHLFPAGQETDRSDHFRATEAVREQIMRQVGDEVPYHTTVRVERFVFTDDVLHISALIMVERPGQKGILIGADGGRLKTIGRSARIQLEQMFSCRVMLKLWVKVRKDWSDRAIDLKAFGYDEY